MWVPEYINVKGRLMDLSTPKVMGILNITPDSFYGGSRACTEETIERRVRQLLDDGADIIDIGGYSSRPYADDVPEEEEMNRLRKGLEVIARVSPDAVVSVDTFRSRVATECVEKYGVAMINDISAGDMDAAMLDTVARLNVPYVMMHMQGLPQNMQDAPCYGNVEREVFLYFARKVEELRLRGVKDIILDPGFGFGKTLEQNYELMAHLEDFRLFGLPLLVGVSRKSMIYKLLGTSPEEALNGTTVLNTVALLAGASILRVHDVREAVEAVSIVCKMKK